MGALKLLDSYKGLAFVLAVVALTLLAGLGRLPGAAVVEFLTFAFPSLVAARAYEESSKAKVTPQPLPLMTAPAATEGGE